MEPKKSACIYTILKFLKTDFESGGLSEESTESLEVAIQCIEAAYGVDRHDADCRNSPDLDLLMGEPSATSTWRCPTVTATATSTSTAPSGFITEEQITQADNIKAEGNMKMKEEDYQGAVDCYTRAISLNPHNAVFFCNRAAAYSKLNNHKAAITDCNSAIALSPTYSKAYGRLGIAYSALKQHELARKYYNIALQQEPDNETYLNNLRLTEEEIHASRLNANVSENTRSATATATGPSVPGVQNFAGLDLGSIMNNPALMTMASHMLSNPNMQNLMSGLMTFGQGDSNVDALLQAGQQLAAQMQSTNPDFVENLRRSMGGHVGPVDDQPIGGSVNPPNPTAPTPTVPTAPKPTTPSPTIPTTPKPTIPTTPSPNIPTAPNPTTPSPNIPTIPNPTTPNIPATPNPTTPSPTMTTSPSPTITTSPSPTNPTTPSPPFVLTEMPYYEDLHPIAPDPHYLNQDPNEDPDSEPDWSAYD